MEYIESPDGERHRKDECTALYYLNQTHAPVAWELSDGTLAACEDCQPVKGYEVFGEEYDTSDAYDAERELTESFWGMFTDDQRTELESDKIAMREAFANWSDSLCKDGSICSDAYNDLDMAY